MIVILQIDVVKLLQTHTTMRFRYFGFIVLLWSIVIIGSSNKSVEDVIYWSESRQLSWADFQGHPDYNYDDIAALTSSGILHFKGCEEGKIIYDIKAYFEKKYSWVKAEALTTHHLEHEQIHFNITQLYAQKLKLALDKETFYCGEGEAFDRFVQDFLIKWQKAPINYDLYTHYSMKPQEQQEWKYKVALELSVCNDMQ